MYTSLKVILGYAFINNVCADRVVNITLTHY